MSDVKIREYINNDINKVIDLNNFVFSKQEYFEIKRDKKWFEWKNFSNPFGHSIIIVAENKKGEIIGSRIFWSWKFRVRSSIIHAYQPVDTVVHPAYRKRGIFKKMTILALNKAVENGAKIIFNFPNENSLPGYLKLGWDFLGKLEWYVKIFNPRYFLYRKFKSTNLIPPKEFTLNHKKLENIKINNVTYDGFIKTLKTKEFLKWRYIEHPINKYGIFECTSAGKTIYSIFLLNQKGKAKELIIVDLFGYLDYIDYMLKLIDDFSRKYRIDIVFIVANKILKYNHFFMKGFVKIKNKNLVCLPLEIGLENKFLDKKNWILFGGMHDAL